MRKLAICDEIQVLGFFIGASIVSFFVNIKSNRLFLLAAIIQLILILIDRRAEE